MSDKLNAKLVMKDLMERAKTELEHIIFVRDAMFRSVIRRAFKRELETEDIILRNAVAYVTDVLAMCQHEHCYTNSDNVSMELNTLRMSLMIVSGLLPSNMIYEVDEILTDISTYSAIIKG